jgi:hypothetical protein
MIRAEKELIRDTMFALALELTKYRNKKYRWTRELRNAFNHSARILNSELPDNRKLK